MVGLGLGSHNFVNSIRSANSLSLRLHTAREWVDGLHVLPLWYSSFECPSVVFHLLEYTMATPIPSIFQLLQKEKEVKKEELELEVSMLARQ